MYNVYDNDTLVAQSFTREGALSALDSLLAVKLSENSDLGAYGYARQVTGDRVYYLYYDSSATFAVVGKLGFKKAV